VFGVASLVFVGAVTCRSGASAALLGSDVGAEQVSEYTVRRLNRHLKSSFYTNTFLHKYLLLYYIK
jgi:hypothetical protein